MTNRRKKQNRWQSDWRSISTHRVFCTVLRSTEEGIDGHFSSTHTLDSILWNGRRKEPNRIHTALHLNSTQSILNMEMVILASFHPSERISSTPKSSSLLHNRTLSNRTAIDKHSFIKRQSQMLLVDKQRPKSLSEMDYHKNISQNLIKMVMAENPALSE